MELDFTRIDKVDVYSIVNNVDIDALQSHVENIVMCSTYTDRDDINLADASTLAFFKMTQYVLETQLSQQDETVSNLARMAQDYQTKKKSVAEKRKELLMIKDTVDILREDVKLKKSGVASMEALLQHKENSNTKRQTQNNMTKHVDNTIPSSSHSKLKLHLADAKGFFVDVLCERFTMIDTLLDDAIKLLALYNEDKSAVKLLHKGIALNRRSKIEDCGIASGDTLLAIVVDRKEYEQPRREPIVDPAAASLVSSSHDDYEKIVKENVKLISEMNEMITNQKSAMESIALNIRNDVKNTLETKMTQLMEQERKHSASMYTYSNNNNMSVDEVKLVKIDEQLESLESLIREVIVEKSFINAGDLESDDEDENLDKIKTAEILISKLQESLIETESAVTSIKEVVDDLKQKLIDVSTIDVTKSVERLIEAVAASAGTSANNLSVSTIVMTGMHNLREEEEENEAVMMLVREIAEEKVDAEYLKAIVAKEEGENEREAVDAVVSTLINDIIDGATMQVVDETTSRVAVLVETIGAATDLVAKEKESEVAKPASTKVADANIRCSISTVVYSSGDLYKLHEDNRINLTIVRGVTQMDDLLLHIRTSAAAKLQIPVACIAVGYNGYHVVTGEDAELLPVSVVFTVDKIPELVKSNELVIKIVDNESSDTQLNHAQVQKLVDNISMNADIMTKYSGANVTDMFANLQKYWDDPAIAAEIVRTRGLRMAFEEKLRRLDDEGYSYNPGSPELHMSSEEEIAIFCLKGAESQLSSDIENAIFVQGVTSNPFNADRLPILKADDIEVKVVKSRRYPSNFKVLFSSVDSAIAALDDIPSDLDVSPRTSIDLGGTGVSSQGTSVTSSQVLRRLGEYERDESGMETPVKSGLDGHKEATFLSALSKGASSLHASPFDDLNCDNDSLVLSEDISFDSR